MSLRNLIFSGILLSGLVTKAGSQILWTAHYSDQAKLTIRSVIAGGDGFVGLADGSIVTSPDGENWAKQKTDSAAYVFSVIWTGKQYVAVGYDAVTVNGIVLTSGNGVDWTAHDPGSDSRLLSVTWTGSQLVAAGTDGTILTSDDGISWKSRSVHPPSKLFSITSTGSLIVAVGESGIILTSPDGTDWTVQSSGTKAGLNTVVWTENQLIAAGDSGTILTSTNGIAWTVRNSGLNCDLNNLAWVGKQFIAVGSFGSILTSPDAVTWTLADNSPTLEALHTVTSVGNRIIITGDNAIVVSSLGGIAWKTGQYDTAMNCNSIARFGNQYIVGGDRGYASGFILASSDGNTWNEQKTGSTIGSVSLVAASENIELAAGRNGSVTISTDGSTWTNNGSLDFIFSNPTSIVWTGSQFVAAVSGGDIFASKDGTGWKHVAFIDLANIFSMIWDANRILAVGSGGMVYQSPDGIKWTTKASGSNFALRSVCRAGTMYVAVGDNGTILTSADGSSWIQQRSGQTPALTTVLWTGSQMVAMGKSGAFLTSSDGVKWSQQNLNGIDFTDAVWTGSQIIAVGNRGRVVTIPLESPSLVQPRRNPKPNIVFRQIGDRLLVLSPRSFPNPETRATVYSVAGRIVFDASVRSQEGITIPIGHLAPGRYWLRLRGAGTGFARAFEIQR